MAKAPILGPSYLARSKALAADRCVNLFPESAPSGPGKEAGALFGCPGLLTKVTLPTQPVYGVLEANDTLYAVGGSKLYVVDSSFSATLIGDVAATSRVYMASNGVDLIISSGYRYVFATSTLAPITDADFPTGMLSVQDGYYLGNVPGTAKIQHSEVDDGSDWDSLVFSTEDGAPDDVVGQISLHREWWILGTKTTAVYYNSGAAGFTFARISGAFFETGCASADSIAKADSSIFWLAKDERGQGIVVRSAGYGVERISTHAIEYAIAGYSDISDAIGFTYQQEGHTFYVLTLPTGNATLVYDISTQLWHERAWRDSTSNSLNRIRANCYCYAHGFHLIGDHTTGAIYALDLDTYADGNSARKWLRTFRVPSDGRQLTINSLEIDMEVGVGLDGTGQGTDPVIMIRASKDGGFTRGNERQVSIGKIGEYSKRVRTTRWGRSNDWVFEVSGTDPVKVVITGARVNEPLK